jgi:hypothetical protein
LQVVVVVRLKDMAVAVVLAVLDVPLAQQAVVVHFRQQYL